MDKAFFAQSLRHIDQGSLDELIALREKLARFVADHGDTASGMDARILLNKVREELAAREVVRLFTKQA